MSNTVLVIGGGFTGLRAAADVVAKGSQAVLLEQRPILGGKRAALLESPESPEPGLAGIAGTEDIECLTLTRLLSLKGDAGQFTATLQEQPRYVTADCTRCNHCVPVCPQVVPNEYDAGLTFRKAIHSPLPKTIPDIYSIDIDSCLNSPPNYLPCQRCAEACDDDAIHFDLPVPAPVEREVASVVLATGFAEASAAERAILEEFGYGEHQDIVSAAEMQRLLEDPGPSGGFAVRPSNENYPASVLLVLTAVTADATSTLGKHLQQLAGQDVEQLSLLVLSAAADDPLLADLQATATRHDANLHYGSWIRANDDGGTLEIAFSALPGGQKIELAVDMVSLYSGIQPDPSTAAMAELLDLPIDDQGYLSAARPGVYPIGGVAGVLDTRPGSDTEREAAVTSALQHTAADTPVASTADDGAAASNLRQEDIEHLLYTLLRLGEGGAR